jgi:WD40 repeat protein
VSDRSLRRALQAVELPDEHEARERAWALVAAAFAEREPQPRQHPRRAAALALAVALVLAAGVLSPPGRALVRQVREAIGVERARPALFSLPAPGRLLVESDAGVWVVRSDGSKRLLDGYREASWSPGGRFLVVARRNELAALEPDGDTRWTLARAEVREPRWGGDDRDTRIAYLRGRELRVVAGDGTGDRRVARRVAAVAPAWHPATFFLLAYATPTGRVVLANADSGRVLWSRAVGPGIRELSWSGSGERLLVRRERGLVILGARGRLRQTLLEQSSATPVTAAAWSPNGRSVAFVQRTAGRSVLWVVPRLRPDASAARRVFSGAGAFSDLAWSPNGRWLLVGWRDADQWVFVRSARVGRLAAVSRITGQFESTRFPRVAGWCCG